MREQKGLRGLRLLLCLGMIMLGLFVPVVVQAASKVTINVLVNGSQKAVLEKTGKDWYLKPRVTATPSIAPDEEEGEEDPPVAAPISFKGIQYVKIPSGKPLVSGYYFFNSKGCLDQRKGFHKIDTKVNGKRFRGSYYFGYAYGRLYMKGGWLTIGSKKYYLSNNGRKYTDCWRSGYYLDSNGLIAKNTATPDGFYVDCDGRKCNKSEMKLSSLKKTLNSMIRGYSGNWSVYVKDLKTGDELIINDTAMYPASVIKLFAMESTYDAIKRGALAKTSYVNSLLNYMITVSDNESFNELVRLNGSPRGFVNGCNSANKYLKKKGYTKTGIHSSLHPSSSSFTSDGGRNTASAKDAGLLLERIYKGKCVSAKYSKEMLNLLLRQTRRWKIPAGLPAGTKVANKTGETDSYQHDTAIVYGPKTDYVICIFSQASDYSGTNGIKKLTARVHSYLNK